jgi:hypothetical protein
MVINKKLSLTLEIRNMILERLKLLQIFLMEIIKNKMLKYLLKIFKKQRRGIYKKKNKNRQKKNNKIIILKNKMIRNSKI